MAPTSRRSSVCTLSTISAPLLLLRASAKRILIPTPLVTRQSSVARTRPPGTAATDPDQRDRVPYGRRAGLPRPHAPGAGRLARGRAPTVRRVRQAHPPHRPPPPARPAPLQVRLGRFRPGRVDLVLRRPAPGV